VRVAFRAACFALAVDLLATAFGAAQACDTGTITASAALVHLYFTAYDQVFSMDVLPEPDGTTYISTGDIKAEWLRDSSAVARAYLGRTKTDDAVRKTLRGVITRQARYILLDPYANAFSVDYQVLERKFELDSLMYPIWLAYAYWHETGDGSIFDGQESLAFDRILSVLRDEQRHSERSHYRRSDLPNAGRGSAVAFTGMVWDGFRPSDDPTHYGYNIPANALAVVVMRYLNEIEQKVYRNSRQAANAWGLATQIKRGIEQYGLVDRSGIGKLYAYEVDGLGGADLMDDANVPSLLSLPYFGYIPVNDATYQTTRRFILSNDNRYFFTGSYAQGIGSAHTPHGYIWPMALIMQAFTSREDTETARVLEYIAASVVGDGRLHESFDANDPNEFTRGNFAWPNALYTELITALQPKVDVASTATTDLECFNGIANPNQVP